MQLRVRRTESGGGRGGPLVRAKPGQFPLSFDVTPVSEDRGNGLENAAFCAPQAGTFVLGLGWLERSSGVISPRVAGPVRGPAVVRGRHLLHSLVYVVVLKT